MPSLPGVNHQRAVKAFKKRGFWVTRESKHITMTDGKRFLARNRHLEDRTVGGFGVVSGYELQHNWPTQTAEDSAEIGSKSS